MDIKPVRRPLPPPAQPPVPPVPQPETPPIVPSFQPAPIDTQGKKQHIRKRKKWLLIVAIILSLGIIAAATAWVLYQVQLNPVDANNKDKVEVVIADGSTPKQIAATLKDEGVVRNETAFLWYTRFDGVQNSLQAGTYRLSPSESTPEIVGHLVKGAAADTFSITFYPGATLVDERSDLEDRRDVTSVLKNAGYSNEEISTALNAQYTHPLLQDKPASADLEGYIFGETYEFASGSTVENILTKTFDEFYSHITENNLIESFNQRGLSLYQGITLASIIQRESGGDDKAQIAQVFYTRLAMDMQLGSDVTYQYIADKTGIARDTNIDSPYNTRRYTGLPPGPIAVPGLAALKAVAAPAEGNYVYFLSGDDNVTYFATTLEGHEANIANHCQMKCQIL
jgi:UPF0755 protein